MTIPAYSAPKPHAPQGPTNIGKAPVDGEGGERGSSAFTGNSQVDQDGVPLDPTAPLEGPATGVTYYAGHNPTPIGTGVQGNTRESAGQEEA